MKKSVRTCLVAAFAVLAVAIAAWALISQFFGNGNIQVYYTQIDNSRITENHSNGGVIDFTGGLAYSYARVLMTRTGMEEKLNSECPGN